MSNYDVAISIDQATLTQVITAIYGRQSLRNKLFSGRQTVSILGEQVTVGWEVQQQPVLSLAPPTTQQWAQAVKEGSGTPQPVENAFTVNFPQLKVTMENTFGGTQEATASLVAICTISISSNRLSLDPVAAVVDLSDASPFDKAIYSTVLIPQVLSLANSILSDEQLPDIDFKGVQFGPAVLVVGTGRIIAIANLQGKPVPSVPSPDSFPNGPLYILLSREAMQQMTNQGAHDLQGKVANATGSRSFAAGNANYNASIRLDSLSASPPDDLTTLNASVGMSVTASAGIDVIGTVGNTVVQGGQTVGQTFESAGKTISDAFSSY